MKLSTALLIVLTIAELADARLGHRELQGNKEKDKKERDIYEKKIRVNIKYKNAEAKGRIKANANSVHGELKKSPIVTVTINEKKLENLKIAGDVLAAEEDVIVTTDAETIPWGITETQALESTVPAPNGSSLCSDPSSFKVAIIDSGLEVNHPDVPCLGIDDVNKNTNCIGSVFFDEDRDLQDMTWHAPLKKVAEYTPDHGTHVFGTIGAKGGNSQGITSMNPDGTGICYIIARIFDDYENKAYWSNILRAIEWALDEDANVINLSIGTDTPLQSGIDIFNRAYSEGRLSVAAAGNKGNGDYTYPASYENVLSVAAVDDNKQRAYFSQFNSMVDIAAPGRFVNSTVLNGGYASKSGTSMATPHVTGAAAKIWSVCRECSNEQVHMCLIDTALDLGSVGRDDEYGHGFLQVQGAYDCLVEIAQCCEEPVEVPPTTPVNIPPTTPDNAPPTTPDNAPPTTPDNAPPTTPDNAPPTTPDNAPPTTPDNAPPTTPDNAPPTTPDNETCDNPSSCKWSPCCPGFQCVNNRGTKTCRPMNNDPPPIDGDTGTCDKLKEGDFGCKKNVDCCGDLKCRPPRNKGKGTCRQA